MSDEESVVVKTYVPRYQKDLWSDHADRLEMSRSEFVRTMVQAGRADFDVPSSESSSSDLAAEGSAGSTPEAGRNEPAENGFDDRILDVLEHEGALDWEDLVDALIDDVEEELDDALGRLQAENRIRYSGRDGGYVLVNDE
ncbi:DUF5805 domain-containing protein [Natrialbaceae archaeon GCM10025810]|uniref:DUF5805 domain-containing protein n=1 Tax=Halovalidus salilacus TaxID=3075124 RepID=UPI00361DBD68